MNIYVYCEGQTEEQFIKKILYPYFCNKNIYLFPIIHETKRDDTKKYKGGVSTYNKISKELKRICAQHKNEFVTTMFDYYGFPHFDKIDKIKEKPSDIYEKINEIEQAIKNDIGKTNLFPNLILHEFEGLLFSDVIAFKSCCAEESIISDLLAAKNSVRSPEYINNGIDTAPSKIICGLFPSYRKITDGVLISQKIGLDKICSECQHFAEWIAKIASMSMNNGE